MIVQLSPSSDPALTDLDRLDRLHAACSGVLADMRFASWCAPADDGAHVWLDITGCRAIGTAASGEAWGEQFDAMIAYATSKGWTDDDGRRVRAHVEPSA